MTTHRRWGSHLPVLMKLFPLTSGVILELGTGIYSTPYLHWSCFLANRKLISYESQEKYYEKARQYRNSRHRVRFAEDWDKLDIEGFFDIIFIDIHPGSKRKNLAAKLKDSGLFIVLHDSEPTEDDCYKYSEIYPLFKYQYHYTKINPNTSVLSNFLDIGKVASAW